jgi:hypothetical protein
MLEGDVDEIKPVWYKVSLDPDEELVSAISPSKVALSLSMMSTKERPEDTIEPKAYSSENPFS